MPNLLEETLALRSRYDEEPSHSDHVSGLALQIFDALQPWHGSGKRPRELLHCAALLHDIGWSQTPDGRGHHKWSARLIRDYNWKNLSPAEIAEVAQIARYHRKVPPQSDHVDFQALPDEGRHVVMVLGGILRLADALDRTHTGRITRVEGRLEPDAIILQVETSGPWDAERTMFETKRDMLQLASGCSLLCEELE